MNGRTLLCAALLLIQTSAYAGMVVKRYGSAPTAGPAAAALPKAKPPTAYVPEVKDPPKLDGKLDDAAWKDAAVIQLAQNLAGTSKADQPTEVRLVRRGKALYVAVKAFEPLLNKLQATQRGHDGDTWADDGVEIFLGTGGEYYHFGITAVASTYDGKGKDKAWNAGAGFQAAAGRGDSEYTLEIAFPLDKMAGEGELPTDWTANFNRNRYVTGELRESSWSPTFSGDSHVPGRFGQLLLKDPPKETGQKPAPVITKKDLEIIPVANGAGVTRFDLSDLPKGAKVYRADLLIFRRTAVDGQMDEARVSVEVYPLTEVVKASGTVTAPGKPLAIRPPWYDRLDATEAVKAALGKGGSASFFVKACPFWDAEGTCLDVYYEDEPKNVPKQVTDVSAVHRAGQTFITWKEIDDPVKADEMKWGALKRIIDRLDRDGRTRYCVYRHSQKITADTIAQAELIAEVKPLSCWNVNGRNIERPIDDYIATADELMTGQWNPFGSASLDGDFGADCPIDRLVIEDGAQPLARQTGLYVYTASSPRREAGVEGGPAQNPPLPAGQVPRGIGERAFYAVVTSVNGVQNTKDFSDANSLAAPVTEVQGIGGPILQRELGKMPFFNFDQKRLHYVRWLAPPFVNLPSEYDNWTVGVPNSLSRDAQRSAVKVPLELSLHRDGDSYWRTQYRIETDSIVLSPYDFPIKSWWYGYHEATGTLRSFDQGSIQPYTERRLLWFIYWAAKKWPVDPNRILVTGSRGGASGSGALHLGLRHPDVFSLVISGHGTLNYASAAKQTDQNGLRMALSMHAVWGKPEWDLKDDQGKPFWPQHDMVALVKATPKAKDLPFVTLTGNGKSAHPFYQAMVESGRGVMGDFAWGGARYMPVTASGTFPNAIWLELALDKAYPACTPPGGVMGMDNSGFGTEYRWKDVVDEPGRFEATLVGAGRGAAAADVTIRRAQKFTIAKGKSYTWKCGDQSGEATVGDDGVLTIPAVKMSGKLTITPK